MGVAKVGGGGVRTCYFALNNGYFQLKDCKCKVEKKDKRYLKLNNDYK